MSITVLSHKLIIIIEIIEWNNPIYQVALKKKYKNKKFPRHKNKKLINGCPRKNTTYIITYTNVINRERFSVERFGVKIVEQYW